ncbi:hypothetical protein [Photobacterium lutimaris]|uniref:Uncharacterized protein n=1 Tax=Photobacterium lutimaris TaxID=388278 RepID=A0A2T3ITN3_9GAMM|nr:hypothetical protein [Photobacterium lutimaris]PSU31725.1 hypothetical protein C9I99_21300 [Photobacterium lutimaris]TDR72635.1 hypothetical protein DFP78_113111 [Photobacterium lutimaris]
MTAKKDKQRNGIRPIAITEERALEIIGASLQNVSITNTESRSITAPMRETFKRFANSFIKVANL